MPALIYILISLGEIGIFCLFVSVILAYVFLGLSFWLFATVHVHQGHRIPSLIHIFTVFICFVHSLCILVHVLNQFCNIASHGTGRFSFLRILCLRVLREVEYTA